MWRGACVGLKDTAWHLARTSPCFGNFNFGSGERFPGTRSAHHSFQRSRRRCGCVTPRSVCMRYENEPGSVGVGSKGCWRVGSDLVLFLQVPGVSTHPFSRLKIDSMHNGLYNSDCNMICTRNLEP